MARAPLKFAAVVPEHELRAFARVAARLLLATAPRGSGPRAARRRRGAGLEPLDHRDYQPGDDLRWVDWRQTARAGHPIVRQFQAESSTDWVVCVDASSSMVVPGGEVWQRAVEVGSGIAYALLELGHRVGLRLFATTVTAACPAGRGAAHYARLARVLASHAPARRGAGSALGAVGAGLRGRPSLFLVSDFLSADGWHADLARLARLGADAHAVQIVSASQRRLPEAGPVELIDVESGARAGVLAGEAAERAAAAEAAALSARLARVCAAYDIRFSAVDSAVSWQRALIAHLSAARRP